MPPIPFQAVTDYQVISHYEPAEGYPYIEPFSAQSTVARFSLIFILDTLQKKILLGLKKRGFGIGVVHGYGGKIEAGETMRQCASRELEEESGLCVPEDDLCEMGRLVFTRPGRVCIDIAIYAADHWTGEPCETEEMSPAWYSIETFDPAQAARLEDGLPFDRMWPDVQLYLEPVLRAFIEDRGRRRVLARIDYAYVKRADHPIQLPPIHDSEKAEEAEMIVAWWMAFVA